MAAHSCSGASESSFSSGTDDAEAVRSLLQVSSEHSPACKQQQWDNQLQWCSNLCGMHSISGPLRHDYCWLSSCIIGKSYLVPHAARGYCVKLQHQAYMERCTPDNIYLNSLVWGSLTLTPIIFLILNESLLAIKQNLIMMSFIPYLHPFF